MYSLLKTLFKKYVKKYVVNIFLILKNTTKY